MPKLKDDVIKKADLDDYLNSYSDFSFELSVLKMLREKNISCEHGGLYEDSVTGKWREFDIRADKTISDYRIRLAIECKNIKPNFPVLISCVPRSERESYHQIAVVGERKANENHAFSAPPGWHSRANIYRIQGENSIYKAKDPVGKSTAQVGRSMTGQISANDGEFYDKWSQSLSSLTDLIADIYWDGGAQEDKNFYLSTAIPIVVVPNGRLWTAHYDNSGTIVQEPFLVERCSCFVDKEYEMGADMRKTQMRISHIEIMTLDGLKSFVDSNLGSDEKISKWFPKEVIFGKSNRKRGLVLDL